MRFPFKYISISSSCYQEDGLEKKMGDNNCVVDKAGLLFIPLFHFISLIYCDCGTPILHRRFGVLIYENITSFGDFALMIE